MPDLNGWNTAELASLPHLCRFHLHYQDYLLAPFVASDIPDPELLTQAESLMERWFQGNPHHGSHASDDAWHPFCVSRRIMNWVLLSLVRLPSDQVMQSLAIQSLHLNRNLEWDLRGNHLLVNLQALAMAAGFFDGPTGNACLKTVTRYLPGQLQEQLLPSGEHFERSPMYHAQMLEAALDMRDALSAVDPQLSSRCGEAAERMAQFLKGILHPDGGIPLFSDSALDETPAPQALIDAAGVSCESLQKPGAEWTGDYWTFRDQQDAVIFDTGAVAADELPAHAHCDLLGFEASISGHRVFVDAGVFDYEDSDMRRHCRSTAAHNVLQIDSLEQCDVWGKFRMGERGAPVKRAQRVDQEFSWAGATHNGYRRGGCPETGRILACRPGGPWLALDWAQGSQERQATIRWHLHPGAQVRIVDDHAVIAIENEEHILQAPRPGRLQAQDYWYCPEFGTRQTATVLVWTGALPADGLAPWSLRLRNMTGKYRAERRPDGCLTMTWTDQPGADPVCLLFDPRGWRPATTSLNPG